VGLEVTEFDRNLLLFDPGVPLNNAVYDATPNIKTGEALRLLTPFRLTSTGLAKNPQYQICQVVGAGWDSIAEKEHAKTLTSLRIE
jgi:hypothetical protein